MCFMLSPQACEGPIILHVQRRRAQLAVGHAGGCAAVDDDVGDGVRHLCAADGHVLWTKGEGDV